MKTYNIDDIMNLRPCYTRDRVAALFGDRTTAPAASCYAEQQWQLNQLVEMMEVDNDFTHA